MKRSRHPAHLPAAGEGMASRHGIKGGCFLILFFSTSEEKYKEMDILEGCEGKQLAACSSDGNYLQQLQVSKHICACLLCKTHLGRQLLLLKYGQSLLQLCTDLCKSQSCCSVSKCWGPVPVPSAGSEPRLPSWLSEGCTDVTVDPHIPLAPVSCLLSETEGYDGVTPGSCP